MDLLYLLKDTFVLFIKLLFITKIKILKNTSNVLWGIKSGLAYTKVSGVASKYILWSGSLWYPVRSSML